MLLFAPCLQTNSDMATLHFKGKSFVQNHHLAVMHHPLVPDKKLSLTNKVSLHDNFIIQGDNQQKEYEELSNHLA